MLVSPIGVDALREALDATCDALTLAAAEAVRLRNELRRAVDPDGRTYRLPMHLRGQITSLDERLHLGMTLRELRRVAARRELLIVVRRFGVSVGATVFEGEDRSTPIREMVFIGGDEQHATRAIDKFMDELIYAGHEIVSVSDPLTGAESLTHSGWCAFMRALDLKE